LHEKATREAASEDPAAGHDHLYERGAAERFAELLDPDAENALRDASLIERARIYRAASLIALGKTEEADAEIARVLRASGSRTATDATRLDGEVARTVRGGSPAAREIGALVRERASAVPAPVGSSFGPVTSVFPLPDVAAEVEHALIAGRAGLARCQDSDLYRRPHSMLESIARIPVVGVAIREIVLRT
jgi:hypothetical protein